MTGTPDLLTETPGTSGLIEEALRMVHLSSAVFLRAEFAAPWAFASLGPHECVQALCPDAERLVLFHIVLEGRCEVRLESGEEASLGPGEAVVLPYGDRHVEKRRSQTVARAAGATCNAAARCAFASVTARHAGFARRGIPFSEEAL